MKKIGLLLLLTPLFLLSCEPDAGGGEKPPVSLVGQTGPGGGVVFYDDLEGFDFDGSGTIEDDEKNLFSGTPLEGNRYLEAAPDGTWNGGTIDPFVAWCDDVFSGHYPAVPNARMIAAEDIDTIVTRTMGYGSADTGYIVEFVNTNGISGTAAQICSDYAGGGMTDWFLPSLAELRLLVHHPGRFRVDILSNCRLLERDDKYAQYRSERRQP